MGWKKDAACRQTGVAPFFNRNTQEEKDTADSFCNVCVVKKECLEYAKTFEKSKNLRIGIWGGLNPNERAKL
jgi:hypothetical protein